MSLGDTILASIGDDGPKPVEVPEWGVTVYLRPFTVNEFMALVGDDSDEDRSWRILSEAVCDEDGAPALTVEQINDMPASQTRVLMRLVREVQAMNGMTDPGEA